MVRVAVSPLSQAELGLAADAQVDLGAVAEPGAQALGGGQRRPDPLRRVGQLRACARSGRGMPCPSPYSNQSVATQLIAINWLRQRLWIVGMRTPAKGTPAAVWRRCRRRGSRSPATGSARRPRRWKAPPPLLWQPNGARVDLPVLGEEAWCTHVAGAAAAGAFERADGTQGLCCGPAGPPSRWGPPAPRPWASWPPTTYADRPGCGLRPAVGHQRRRYCRRHRYDAAGKPRATRWTAPTPAQP